MSDLLRPVEPLLSVMMGKLFCVLDMKTMPQFHQIKIWWLSAKFLTIFLKPIILMAGFESRVKLDAEQVF